MTATTTVPTVAQRAATNSAPVVVGVLDAVTSAPAVAWAAAEATALQTSLTVLHAWSWPGLAPWHLKLDDEISADLEHSSDALLDDCRRIAREHGATAITASSVEGGRIEALAGAASDAAVLVLGSRHLGSFGSDISCSSQARCLLG